MKKYSNIILIMIAALFSSCAKESIENAGVDAAAIVNEDSQYLSSFAQILSAAVYNEPELRDYIKKEALAEFDMDHDVFYPFVKDEVVSGGKTFGDILDKYDTEGVLEEIEAHEPLLNILVPDWSWVDEGCFSVKTWDTSLREVAVTYDCTGAEIPLYGKGQLLGSMKSGEFTSMPVLVVKRNERMVYNPTKSGPVRYDFYDPVYDKSRQVETKGTWYEHVYDFDVASPDNTIHPMAIQSKVKAAYTQSQQNYNLKQRDHIYYNMTAVRDTGAIDFHYAESLLRFRFNSANLEAFSDDPYSGNQMVLNEIAYNYGPAISEDALKQYGWIEGNYELVIVIKAGVDQTPKVLPSKKIADAFNVDKVHFKWYQDIFNTVTYRRYWVNIEDFVPKWVTLNEELFTWDLSDYPMKYYIEFKERDTGATIVLSGSQTYQYATNFNVSGDCTNVKVGYGAGASAQASESITWSFTLQDGDDDLGATVVQYINPIITNISGNKATLYTYSTGSTYFQILPIKLY